MTIYSALLCAALLWLGIWAIWPGLRRDNCTACAWHERRGPFDCAQLSLRGIPRHLQHEIVAGRWICPERRVEKQSRKRRWWDRG